MTAHEAHMITKQHSIRMNKVFKEIEAAAQRGESSVHYSVGDLSDGEMEVLKHNGFKAGYEFAEADGMQFIQVSW